MVRYLGCDDRLSVVTVFHLIYEVFASNHEKRHL